MKPLAEISEIALLAALAGILVLAPIRACAQTPAASQAASEDTVLFDFKDAAGAADWSPAKLPEVKTDQPAPKVEIVTGSAAGASGLKLTFDGGDWPVVATTNIPVEGNWKPFQTLKATLTADKPIVAYFRILQGKPDDKGKHPYWEHTMILQKGVNDLVLTIRSGPGAGVIDPKNGDITSFIIGAFQPAKGQTLVVNGVLLSKVWPPPKVIGWYSPYCHDGYSSSAAAEFKRTGTLPRFKVLGAAADEPQEVADCADLARQLKDKWTKPEPKTIEQVEADFRAGFEALKKDHPKAVMAILREGEKGYDPAAPDKAYAGWKFVYISCHGPDGPNPGREKTPAKYETVEAFMRHRSPILQADLSSIPKGAAVLAARLVVTRVGAADLKVPEKPNMWVAEPCNREWDDTAANCYFYAKGKLWKAVSGLYYGEDPDYWPVLLMHGPAGGGAVSDWDFTEALKFWTGGQHENHGFFLYGESSDYMSMYTPKAKDIKQRPAIMVVYEPKQ
ncbi:MAG: hypothetical protein ACE15C_17635 [Phycisphaerae bacterium]